MKRFWTEVSVVEAGPGSAGGSAGGWQVALDGRPLKTQGKREQIVPTKPLAEALGKEWADQGEKLDPATLPQRDMADFAIDRIASGEEDVVSKLVAFAETDTLCYRADPGEALFRRQNEQWEPLLTALEQRENILLERISGVIHRPQPAASMDALRGRFAREDAFTLAPLFTLASLAASACIALSALEADADAEHLWTIANLEEDWQAEIWGLDAEASAVRERNYAAFRRAFEFLKLARGAPS